MADLNRRAFGRHFGQLPVATLALWQANGFAAKRTRSPNESTLRDRVRGLLVGSLIGDAAGRPVEFKSVAEVHKWLPDARSWPESKKLNDEEIRKLSSSLPLLPYEGIRPDSVAQIIGAFAGAIHGTKIFPRPFRAAVAERLAIEYGEDINGWVDLLVELSDRSKYPQPVSLE